MSTVKVTLHLWTDETDRTCWDYGKIAITQQPEHEINKSGEVFFNHLDELPRKLLQLLEGSGAVVDRKDPVTV